MRKMARAGVCFLVCSTAMILSFVGADLAVRTMLGRIYQAIEQQYARGAQTPVDHDL